MAQAVSVKSDIDKKVEALLKKITLEEKVGHMNQYNGFWEITGLVPNEGNAKLKYDHLKKGLVGSVLKAIERSVRVSAIEASAVGINWTFAPMIDIFRDARWGRVMEGAGEDPCLGSKIGVARIRGFQGDDLSKNN